MTSKASALLRIMSIFGTILCILRCKILRWLESVSKEVAERVSHEEKLPSTESGPRLISISPLRSKTIENHRTTSKIKRVKNIHWLRSLFFAMFGRRM